MKNSFKLFTFKGIPVYLKYWIFILLLFIPINIFIYLFISILIHELAHAYKADKLGYNTSYIFLNIFHGGALVDNLYLKNDKHTISIALAGPLSNLFLSIFGIFLAATLLLTESLSKDSMIIENIGLFTYINLFLFLINIIPIYPLDGGRISRSLFKIFFGKKSGILISSILSITLSLVALVYYSIFNLDFILIVFSVISILYTYQDLKNDE